RGGGAVAGPGVRRGHEDEAPAVRGGLLLGECRRGQGGWLDGRGRGSVRRGRGGGSEKPEPEALPFHLELDEIALGQELQKVPQLGAFHWASYGNAHESPENPRDSTPSDDLPSITPDASWAG